MASSNANRGMTVSLFSEVKGRITLHGEPIEGALVTREYTFTWSDKKRTETTYTDKEGRFSFDEATGTMILGRFLPHEPVIPQAIVAHHQGKDYEVWMNSKRNYDSMGEMYSLADYREVNNPVINAFREGYILLECELASKESNTDDSGLIPQSFNFYSAVYSLCDMQFPYQQAVDRAGLAVKARSEALIAQIDAYLSENSDALSGLNQEGLESYTGATFSRIDSVRFYGDPSLNDHSEHYTSKTVSVDLNAEVLMLLSLSNGSSLKARAWLSDARFVISPEYIRFEPHINAFVFNKFNIDPTESID